MWEYGKSNHFHLPSTLNFSERHMFICRCVCVCDGGWCVVKESKKFLISPSNENIKYFKIKFPMVSK